MFGKTIAVALTAIVSCLTATAQAQGELGGQAQGQPDRAASVRAKMRKIGTGEKSVVRVKLKDGTELRDYPDRRWNRSLPQTL